MKTEQSTPPCVSDEEEIKVMSRAESLKYYTDSEDFKHERYACRESFISGFKECRTRFLEWHNKEMEKKEQEAVKFADWVIENYAKVKSELGLIAYVNIKTNKVLIHGNAEYYANLINRYGKTIEELYAQFLTEKKK